MKRTSSFSSLFAAAIVALGCGSRETPEPAAQTATPAPVETPAPASDPAVPVQVPVPAGDAAAAGGEVQIAGTLGCGHCTFHVTSECAAVVRTASGESYVLDGVDESSDLWAKRMETGHKITVTGKVAGTDAVKHVAMTSFELD